MTGGELVVQQSTVFGVCVSRTTADNCRAHSCTFLCRGSYSYPAKAGGPAAYEAMAAPITLDGQPRVLFAGEGTFYQHFGTVHGAYYSGLREADRLLTQTH